MSLTAVQGRLNRFRQPDPWVVGAASALIVLGLIMVTSASMGIAERQLEQPFHYVFRQGMHVVLGLALAVGMTQVPLAIWARNAPLLLGFGVLLLFLILIPGIGHEVKGSARWIPLGPIRIQPSELIKLFLVVWLAAFVARHGEALRTTATGFLMPMGVVVAIGFLLMLQPDFGTVVVLLVTASALLYLAGASLWRFALAGALAAGVLALLVWSSPYRVDRVTAFLDPWSDPYAGGFQLTQALIAFGRGEWFGVGLGDGVQKLFYLPEAHTDFLLAVLAEELGLIGVVAVLGLFAILAWRAFAIGMAAEQARRPFVAYLAYGIGITLSLQVFVNAAVNMGLAPTKGLTLPLMSYGGSSMAIMCAAMGLLLRAEFESRTRASPR